MPLVSSSQQHRFVRDHARQLRGALSSRLHATVSLVVVMSALQLAAACPSTAKNAPPKESPAKATATAAAKPIVQAAPAKPFVPIVIPDSADQLIFGFHANLTNNGVAHGTVTADSALLYDDATRIDLRRVTVNFESATGIKIGTLTADRGTLLVNTSTLSVRGNVIATGADNRRLETTRATFSIARNVLIGDTAYVLSGGLTSSKTKGASFELDGKLTKPVIVKPVVPKAAVDKTKDSKKPATTPNAKPVKKPPV